ncbi:hypothetical protein ACQKJG_27520 [Priestia megaterium]|uniref:hypothetical protein n=1 Tax=Priestia megaterium TaxID=1404 RepID=UPI003CFE1DFF
MNKTKFHRWFKHQSFISKSLLAVFICSLLLTTVSFEVADYKHQHFYIEQDNIINKTKGILGGKSILNELESREIYQMVQDHQNNYPTYQFLAFYPKEANKNSIYQYDSLLADASVDKAQYVYPLHGQVKRGFLADSFYVTEVLEAGDWYIVQQYHPTGGYYYEVTIVLLSLTIVSLIIYLFKEGWRYLKQGVRIYKNA